ncbi:hypothetical protein J7L13_01460 [bacterium]|nr:hypothetical protein [bacterium]
MWLENIEAEVVKVAWGIQHTFAARFLDSRGSLMESGLKLFEDPREVEIRIESAFFGEEIRLQSKSKGLLLTVNPVKTTIEVGLPGSLDEFSQLIERFCNEQSVKNYFSDLEFNFIGTVCKVRGTEVDNIASKLLPQCKGIFNCLSEEITFARITYIDGNYRVHLTLSLNPSTKRYDLDLDTQKIHSINFSEAPLLVKESYNRLEAFFHQFKSSIKKGGKP